MVHLIFYDPMRQEESAALRRRDIVPENHVIRAGRVV